MILRRLALRHFRKYRAVDVEFPPGLVAVVGKNEAGKTTLFEAVAVALYGSKAARGDLLGCISDLCAPGDHCEIDLELSVRGRRYRVVRRIHRNGAHQAELFEGENPEPVAVGPTAVEARVGAMLGIPFAAGAYVVPSLSPADRDLANLCLHLAISQVAASRRAGDASLLVFDDVLASQDDQRREGILQALERPSETPRQVFVATNAADMGARVPSVLRVTENAEREAQIAWA